MAGTTRTRKTAAAKTAEASDATTEAAESASTAAADESATEAATAATVEESETAPADSAAKAPEAAPLEPPAVQEAPEAPAAPVYATPTEVIPDEENLAEVIIDDTTKEPPADVDSVFVPLTEYGSVLVCTVRLVEKTFLGPHRNPVHRLLQPAGAHVSESVAARIRERLQDQAARLAAQAEK
ncbi:hypothetical protein SAMN05216483_6749 [Streptomyces sp. 2131.1]|uniref:hypothetical protein n=1 Tax=Streptomyces sp. 2131.1 TaxID=1855346 RepID=UPI0008947D38|nr:hypothetical protein [Streptomyces sp. 2131.1]SEE84289.1 hypothetical protein SAMN05216483_6749 [Streptomyces sp. 2131.1]